MKKEEFIDKAAIDCMLRFIDDLEFDYDDAYDFAIRFYRTKQTRNPEPEKDSEYDANEFIALDKEHELLKELVRDFFSNVLYEGLNPDLKSLYTEIQSLLKEGE